MAGPGEGNRISVAKLCRDYRVHRRAAGLVPTLRSVLRRRYDTVHAVDDLSFDIAPGERVGFLGPNGAGKTTTLKVLAGLLHPTSGSVRVAGFDPTERRAAFLRKITLVMGQKQQLIWDLPPAETFAYNRAVYEIPKDDFERNLVELSRLLEIEEIAKKPTRQLSLGERMKCELCAALLHRPSVLFLDEPTIGLDVAMQLAVRGFIRTYNERSGATTLLTSHYMEDVVALCPRVIVIDQGRLLYDGDLTRLVQTLRPEKRVVLRYATPPERAQIARVGTVVTCDATTAVVSVPQASLRDAVAHLLADKAVVDLTVEDPPLEEVLRDLFAHPSATNNKGPAVRGPVAGT